MKDVNAKKYHGYLALPRHLKLLQEQLGYKLFGFYTLLVMEANWHRGNPNFGKVTKTQNQLAKALKVHQSIISRNLKKLSKFKYCIINHKDYIILGYFPLFLTDVASKMHSKSYADLHQVYADMYEINAELQVNYANSHSYLPQNNGQRLYSSSSYKSYLGLNGDVFIDNDEIDRELSKKGGN